LQKEVGVRGMTDQEKLKSYLLNADEALLIETFRELYWTHERHAVLDILRVLTKEDVEIKALNEKYGDIDK